MQNPNPPLTTPAKRAALTRDERQELVTAYSVSQASDAETQRRLLAYDAVPYLKRNGLCLCVHCLYRYSFPDRELAAYLIVEVQRQLGTPPVIIPHSE